MSPPIKAAVVLWGMALALGGCIRIRLTAARSPDTTQERYDELKATESGCLKRGNRTIECLLDAPLHRSRVRFLTGVRSVDDVRILRSGRICAALPRGGVKCLGVDMIRAVESGNVSTQRAFLWDDGYCVQERDQRRVRCEWFSPDFEFDRRVLFLKLPGTVRFESFPGGMCACSNPIDAARRGASSAPGMAACLRTKLHDPHLSYTKNGEREVRGEALETVQFIATEPGQNIGVCDEIRAGSSTIDKLMSDVVDVPE